MPMEIVLALAALAIILGLNVKATISILRDTFSERTQKIAQLLIVWLVPIVGAIVVLAIHRPTEAPSRKYREAPDTGEDFALSGRHAKNVGEAIDGD